MVSASTTSSTGSALAILPIEAGSSARIQDLLDQFGDTYTEDEMPSSGLHDVCVGTNDGTTIRYRLTITIR
jgi:hypothetical protein